MTIPFKSVRVKDETYEMLIRWRKEMSREKRVSFDEVIQKISEKAQQAPKIDEGPIWGFNNKRRIL